ncbi:MAG TPA: hypothetical protein VFA78_01425 [Chloroflexota bacterium]|nr:hypothetical protein [Chloroflexota bacterium]
MDGATWLGLFLDVDTQWWESGEGKDLYVRLSGVESTPGSGTQASWAVFARPGADASGDHGPTPYARFVAGESERRLVRMAEHHGYTRCRLGDLRFFAGWRSLINRDVSDDWEAADTDVAEPDDGSITGSACSMSIVVGDTPRYVLVHIRRDGGGAESWHWDEHPNLSDAVSLDDEAVAYISTGGGVFFGVQENEDGTRESFSRPMTEEDESRFPGLDDDEVLSHNSGPTMTWFKLAAPRRPRPRLTKVEEIALGKRIVQASSIFGVSDNQMDGGGSLEDCSAEDIAELNWGLVNGRTRVYDDWNNIELPGDWRERIDSKPGFWSQFSDAPPVRPPWNAVVRYDPPDDESYRAMYFLARLGIPSDTDELRVNQDELPALMLCLAVGTLDAVRSGASNPEAARLAFEPLLWWLSERVPHDIVELLDEAVRELDPARRSLPRPMRDMIEAPPNRAPDQDVIDNLLNRMRTALAQLPVPAWHLLVPVTE